MARGRKTALTICLTPADRQTLLAWQQTTTITAARARRGRIILLLEEEMPILTIATTVGLRRRNVYKWVRRFLAAGVPGLADQPRPGRRGHPPHPDGAARGRPIPRRARAQGA